MTKNQIIAEHVVVTFFEAAVAYTIIIPTINWNKSVLVGAIGAGLSAVYNVLRQSTPTLLTPVENVPTAITVVNPPTAPVQPVVTPEQPTPSIGSTV